MLEILAQLVDENWFKVDLQDLMNFFLIFVVLLRKVYIPTVKNSHTKLMEKGSRSDRQIFRYGLSFDYSEQKLAIPQKMVNFVTLCSRLKVLLIFDK